MWALILKLNGAINSFVWGIPAVSMLAIGGIFLTIGLRFVPWLKLFSAMSYVFTKKEAGKETKQGIAPRAALFTALAGTVGTGNIAGVATAIYFGGPGALFYMWVMALIGMAIKFAEITLAVHYRETNDKGEFIGGPMYYIKNGLKDRLPMLASILSIAYAILGAFYAFFAGSSIQSHSIAGAINQTFNISISPFIGIALVILVGLVIVGGIKRIAHVANKLVPSMIIVYLVTGIVVMILFAKNIPAAFQSIFAGAFGVDAAAGGAVGTAISFGFRRGVFSNEAGVGTAAIAHASANTEKPIRQGMISVLGIFIDTIIVCSITGLTIIMSGLYTPGGALNGSALTAASFDAAFKGGDIVVTICLALFAYTTILGWSLYGERCTEYLFKTPLSVKIYRTFYLIMLYLGSVTTLETLWGFADTANGLMIMPNLITLIILGPMVFKLTKEYMNKEKSI